MKVLLLAGGKSIEHDVSVRSGQTIARALDALGHEYEVFDPICSDEELVAKAKNFDVVFMALHGKPGEDGTLQEMFEANDIPYQCSNARASKLCINKAAYKELLIQNNILVPKGKLVALKDIDDDIFSRPYVLKPNDEGSSLGTIVVRSVDAGSRAEREKLLNQFGQMLAEELIDGPEITVGVFEDKALPVIEIVPPVDGEFDYENKYNGKTRELLPPINVSEELQLEAQELTLRIHKLAGCSVTSRTDLMVQSDKLYVLETNTIPGLTDQSLLPKMLAAAGYTMPQFVDSLLQEALSRQQ